MSSKKPVTRSKPFAAARSQHKTETAEDYTELIAELIRVNGRARTCDIANQLGVSHVTAIRTIGRLVRDGYLQTAPHKPVELTEKGKRLAKASKERHDLLLEFLLALGVPQKVAEQDVEGVEHHVSAVSLAAIRLHLKMMKM